MFFRSATLVFAGLLSVQQAAAVKELIDKPLIQPPFMGLDNGAGLWKFLKPTQSTYTLWGWGWLPNRCKMEADEFGYQAYDMEVFNVKYTDCGDVWIMCRHKDTQITREDMIDTFGRMPVQARQYVRHVVALPDPNGGHARTWSQWGDVCIYGYAKNPSLWAHEIGHAVDMLKKVGTNIPQPFSGSQTWKRVYDESTAISDDYAQNNQAENFAQEFVISLFANVVDGGIGTIQPNWKAIYPMYSTIQQLFGDSVKPGGTCTTRIVNDYAVCMGIAAGCMTAKRAAPVFETDGSIPRLALPLVKLDEPICSRNSTSDGSGHSH